MKINKKIRNKIILLIAGALSLIFWLFVALSVYLGLGEGFRYSDIDWRGLTFVFLISISYFLGFTLFIPRPKYNISLKEKVISRLLFIIFLLFLWSFVFGFEEFKEGYINIIQWFLLTILFFVYPMVSWVVGILLGWSFSLNFPKNKREP